MKAEDAQSGEHHPRTAVLVVEVAGEALPATTVPGVSIDVAGLFR